MKRFIMPLVMALALILRLVSLDSRPVGFTPDEASFGYDAYSLIHTGRDQWGEVWPLVFKSFGDYKSPLLVYLEMPFVAIGGLTKASVRLPNAILGVLSVLVTYLLVKELYKKSEVPAIIAAFLLCISSWHIMLSRGAFEANLTTFFLPLGFYLFLKGLNDPKYLFWSAIIFGLNLFTYHSAKLVTPLLVLFLFIYYRTWKTLPVVVFTLMFLLMIYTQTLGGIGRISERSIFVGALDEGAKIKIAEIQKGANPILARLLHNKYQVVITRFIGNYQQYFSGKFLFTQGPKETTYGMLPGRGVLYWFELVFIAGLVLVIVDKSLRKLLAPVIVWLLIAPVPAALSTGVGYAANRVAIMMPAMEILLAFGAFQIYFKLKKFEWLALSAIGIFALANFVSFTDDYFVKSPSVAAEGMLAGNLEMAQWLTSDSSIQTTTISRRLSEPQIYLAFAGNIDPKIYQAASANWDLAEYNVNWVDQIPEYSLGKYQFSTLEDKTGLLVGKPEEFAVGITPKKIFNYPNGQAAIYAYEQN
jgi:4-amino-4-deoxy-L-arabinose transferase-like glycosyltransferase